MSDQGGDEKVDIHVCRMNGLKSIVETSLDSTVKSFKTLFQQICNVPASQQHLIYCIEADHTVHMVQRPTAAVADEEQRRKILTWKVLPWSLSSESEAEYDFRSLVQNHFVCFQSRAEQALRQFLQSKNFIGIHTPNQGTATQVPRVQIAAAVDDLGKTFEVGPRFEGGVCGKFVHFDVGMQIRIGYSEIMNLVEELCEFIFTYVKENCKNEVRILGRRFASEPLKLHPKRLTFAEGVQMLTEAGVDFDPLQDLSTETLRKLGQLVLDKYNTDFYILHRHPLALRPFYTMPCAESDSPGNCNSFDVFLRGEKIISGGQTISHGDLFEKRAKDCGVVDLQEAARDVELFRYYLVGLVGGFTGNLEQLANAYLGVETSERDILLPHGPERRGPYYLLE